MEELSEKHLERMVYRVFRSAYEEERGGRVAPPNLIYVTDLTQCLLKSWFSRTFGEPPSDEKIVVLVLGDDVHYLLNERFPIGQGEKSAEKVYKNVTIRGRADRVLSNAIVEFKTITSTPEKPLDHHVLQAQLYMWLFEKSKGYIVYVAKKNGAVRVFSVDRDDKVIESLLERACVLAKHLEEGTMPNPETGWLCRFCEYKEWCPAHKGREEK